MNPLSRTITLLLCGLLTGCASTEELVKQAEVAADAGRFERASALVRQGLEEYPRDTPLRETLVKVNQRWAMSRLKAAQGMERDSQRPLIERLRAALAEGERGLQLAALPVITQWRDGVQQQLNAALERQRQCLAYDHRVPTEAELEQARAAVALCQEEDSEATALQPIAQALSHLWAAGRLKRIEQAVREGKETLVLEPLTALVTEVPDYLPAKALLERLQSKVLTKKRLARMAELLQQKDAEGALAVSRLIDPTTLAHDEALAIEMDRLGAGIAELLLVRASQAFQARKLGQAVVSADGAVTLAPQLRSRPELLRLVEALDQRAASYLERQLYGNAYMAYYYLDRLRKDWVAPRLKLAELRQRLRGQVIRRIGFGSAANDSAVNGQMVGEMLKELIEKRVTPDLQLVPVGQELVPLLSGVASGDGLPTMSAALQAGGALGVDYLLIGVVIEHRATVQRTSQRVPFSAEVGKRKVPNPEFEAFKKANPDAWESLVEEGKAPPPEVEQPLFRTFTREEGVAEKRARVGMRLRLDDMRLAGTVLSKEFLEHSEVSDHFVEGVAEAGAKADPEMLPEDAAMLEPLARNVAEQAATAFMEPFLDREQIILTNAHNISQEGEYHAAIEKLVEAWILSEIKQKETSPIRLRLEQEIAKAW